MGTVQNTVLGLITNNADRDAYWAGQPVTIAGGSTVQLDGGNSASGSVKVISPNGTTTIMVNTGGKPPDDAAGMIATTPACGNKGHVDYVYPPTPSQPPATYVPPTPTPPTPPTVQNTYAWIVSGHKYNTLTGEPLSGWRIVLTLVYSVPYGFGTTTGTGVLDAFTDSDGYYAIQLPKAPPYISATLAEELQTGWHCTVPGDGLSMDVDFNRSVVSSPYANAYVTNYHNNDFYNRSGPVTYNQSHDLDFLLRKMVDIGNPFDTIISRRYLVPADFDVLIQKAHPSPLPMDVLNQKAYDKGYPYDILNQKAHDWGCPFDIINALRLTAGVPTDVLTQNTHDVWFLLDSLVQGPDECSCAVNVRFQSTITQDILANTQRFSPQFPAIGIDYETRPYNIYDSRKETKT